MTTADGNNVLTGNDIALVRDDKMVNDDHDLGEIFNDYYINIVENTSNMKHSSITNATPIEDDQENVRSILDKYKDHPSILGIVQDHKHTFKSFSFHARDAWLQLKMLDGSKSTGVDQIPPKSFIFHQNATTAAVCPVDKGEPVCTVGRNCCPVSILNTFSKVYICKNSKGTTQPLSQ